MNVVATSIFSNGLIKFPSGISGTIYFADFDQDYVSGAVVRSYIPTTTSNKINVTRFADVMGMNPIFDGTKLSVIAQNFDTGDNLIYIYDPLADTWINSTDSMNLYLPYTYSVSGDLRYVFFATTGDGSWHNPPDVYVLDTQLATMQEIITDGVDIPAGWLIYDMTLATRYTSGSPGELVLYITDATGESSSVINYIIPASPPYISGTWTDIAPTQFITGSMPPTDSNFAHSALAIRNMTSGSDEVFARFWYPNPALDDKINHRMVVTPLGNIIIAGGNDGSV